MLGSILGGAALGLVGSIFGGGDKKQTTTSEVDYVKMARNAERAGFNPLTALRNGGAAGFSTSTTIGSGGGLGQHIGAALEGGIRGWLDFDPMKEKKAVAEYDLLQAQLGEFNDRAEWHDKRMSEPKIGAVPTAVSAGGKTVAGGASLGLASDFVAGDAPAVTNPSHKSWGWKSNPYFSDAETWETRHGELGGSIIGLGVLGADAYWNAKPHLSKAFERAMNPPPLLGEEGWWERARRKGRERRAAYQ